MNKLDQAKEYQQQGEFEKVDELFAEIIQEEPENHEVLFMLAKSKMNQNKLEDAYEAIDKALALNDVDPEYYQIKGNILARSGEFDEAISALKTALKENPNFYQSHIVIGHLYYTKGQRKKAESHFQMALKIDGFKVEAQVNLIKIQIDQGDIERAIKRLRNIEQQNPNDPSIKMMMGQAYLENGAYSFAEKYFQKVIQEFPNYDLAHLYHGITKIYTGENEMAERIIQNFTKKYPNVKEGIAAKGLMLFKNSRFKAAAEHLKSAISHGISPISWNGAYVESLARMGQIKPAIDFYKKLVTKYDIASHSFRLAELYEMQGKVSKAIKQYKKTKQTDGKYILSLLGLARCYLLDEDAENAEETSRKVLTINANSEEATLILINSLLFKDDVEQALEILKSINYKSLNDVFKKTFRVLHANILDHQGKYDRAMGVYTDKARMDVQQVPKNKALSEEDLKKIQSIDTEIKAAKNEPIFIIGTQSTDIYEFNHWLMKQGVKVLSDRLVSHGRPDMFYSYQEIDDLLAIDGGTIRVDRDSYHQKAKVIMATEEEKPLFADCLYINPYQMSVIKKYFPHAHVILLNRDSADIWLNQKAFGEESIAYKDWNESINQILSMGLNLTLVNIDEWLEGDEKLIKKLSKVFDTDLQANNAPPVKYWRTTFFPRGHWKNYKKHLG
jgi:tetratricopeptide (TPR) repeat protein